MKINAEKMKLAQKFLNELKKRLREVRTKDHLYLEAYSNGREQGYHLRAFFVEQGLWWGCSFSENRNSDQLVVYIGTRLVDNTVDRVMLFDMAGNIPHETVYRNAKRYSQEDLGAAATNVIASLKICCKGKKEMTHVS